MAEFLLELFSEDIPARMQVRAADNLKDLLKKSLVEKGLAFEEIKSFSTPRRIGVVVKGLPEKQPDVTEENKGPSTKAPEQAIQGFLRGNGLESLKQCEKRELPKGEFWFVIKHVKGRMTSDVLSELAVDAIKSVSWAKSMKWSDTAFRWVRPLRSILAVFDNKALSFTLTVGGNGITEITSSNTTSGHRFLAPDIFEVTSFEDYSTKLKAAFVIIERVERKEMIVSESLRLAKSENLSVAEDDALLEEVIGLNEWPIPLLGKFDDDFLKVPQEALISSMREHQKYFSLLNADKTLANKFILVSNMKTEDGGLTVVKGNERVLRARLSDAKFFWDQDCKKRLEERCDNLKKITFHAKLGSVAQKVERMTALSGYIAEMQGNKPDDTKRAASLSKADLSTGMVGEFADLQGTMGKYYALADGEKISVANAIETHYKPAGPADLCPSEPVSIAVALSDKIDTLYGFFAINEKPTGSKDPYALRRAALGVIRLIVENQLRLNLKSVFKLADDVYKPVLSDVCFEAVYQDLMRFIADRLKVVLREQGVRHDLIDAVFSAHQDDDLTRLLERVKALQSFLTTENGSNLLAAYKRASNIVRIETKKDGIDFTGHIANDLLEVDEESALFSGLEKARDEILPALQEEDFKRAMSVMAGLRTPVDQFFEKVTVNADQPEVRTNRLKLLSHISGTLNQVADFSKIEG